MRIDTGDTAWVLISSALILCMTPGLAFFYAGMVRSKNVLGMLMQNYFAIGLISVLWALLGFTKTLAMELGPEGIRVNAICPGSIKGPRIDGVIERDAVAREMTAAQIRKLYERQVSLRQFVDAEDVANTAYFLASSQGRMISGQIIGVDGHTESLSNWLDD